MNGKKQKRLSVKAVNKHLSALRDTERSSIGSFQCIKILTWLRGWGRGGTKEIYHSSLNLDMISFVLFPQVSEPSFNFNILNWLTEHSCAYWYFLRCENHFPSVENSVSDNNRDNSLNSFKRRTNYKKGNTRPYIFDDVNVRFVIRKKSFSRKSRIVLEDLSLNNDLRW